jgi:PBSX family phage terminase large subunit
VNKLHEIYKKLGWSIKQGDFINPNRKQHKIEILAGVTGCGKSFAANTRTFFMLRDKVKRVMAFSGNTFSTLYANVVDCIMGLDKGDNILEYQKPREGPRIVNKETGTVAILIGANDKTAEGRIRGLPVCHFWYGDEITLQPKPFVSQALARLRFEDENKNLVIGDALWTCNPDSPSHYIKTKYIDSTKKDVYHTAWGFYDNPIITDKYIEGVKERFDGVFAERMIYGKWTSAEGAVYNRFSRDVHVVDEWPDKVIEYVIGIDWGYAKDHPLAIVLLSIDYNGDYCICDEIKLEGQLIDKSLIDIITNRGWYKLKVRGVTDKPYYAFADSARPDYVNQFHNISGISTLFGDKSVNEGIQSVQRRLVPDKSGKLGLTVYKGCTQTIFEFENYVWDQNIHGGKDVPKSKDDHILDAVRYVIHTKDRNTVRQVADPRKKWDGNTALNMLRR